MATKDREKTPPGVHNGRSMTLADPSQLSHKDDDLAAGADDYDIVSGILEEVDELEQPDGNRQDGQGVSGAGDDGELVVDLSLGVDALMDDQQDHGDEKKDQGRGDPGGESDSHSPSPELESSDADKENQGVSHNGARGKYLDKNLFYTDAIRGGYYLKGQPIYSKLTTKTCQVYVDVATKQLYAMRHKMKKDTIYPGMMKAAGDELELLGIKHAPKIKGTWFGHLLNVTQIYKSEYHNLYPDHFDENMCILPEWIMPVNNWDTSLGNRLKPEHYPTAIEPSFIWDATVYIDGLLRAKALKSIGKLSGARAMNANVVEPISGDSGDDDDSDYEDEPPKKRRRKSKKVDKDGDRHRHSSGRLGRGARVASRGKRKKQSTPIDTDEYDESSDESGDTVINRRNGGDIKVKLGTYTGGQHNGAKAQAPRQGRSSRGVFSHQQASGATNTSKNYENVAGNRLKNKVKNTRKKDKNKQKRSSLKTSRNGPMLRIPKYGENRPNYSNVPPMPSTISSSNHNGAPVNNQTRSISTRNRKTKKRPKVRIMKRSGGGLHTSGGHHRNGGPGHGQAVSGAHGGGSGAVPNYSGSGTAAVARGQAAGGRGGIRHRRRDAENDQIAQDMVQDEQRPRDERQYRSRTTVCLGLPRVCGVLCGVLSTRVVW